MTSVTYVTLDVRVVNRLRYVKYSLVWNVRNKARKDRQVIIENLIEAAFAPYLAKISPPWSNVTLDYQTVFKLAECLYNCTEVLKCNLNYGDKCAADDLRVILVNIILPTYMRNNPGQLMVYTDYDVPWASKKTVAP